MWNMAGTGVVWAGTIIIIGGQIIPDKFSLLNEWADKFSCLKPLLPEALFEPNFEIYPKIGFNRLQTHRRGAHRKFLMIPSYFRFEILAMRTYLCTLCNKVLIAQEIVPALCGVLPLIIRISIIFHCVWQTFFIVKILINYSKVYNPFIRKLKQINDIGCACEKIFLINRSIVIINASSVLSCDLWILLISMMSSP